MSSENNWFLLASGRGSISEPWRLYMQSSRIWLTGGECDVDHKKTVTTKLIAEIWKRSKTATTNSDGMMVKLWKYKPLTSAVHSHCSSSNTAARVLSVLNDLKELNFRKNSVNIWIFWQLLSCCRGTPPSPAAKPAKATHRQHLVLLNLVCVSLLFLSHQVLNGNSRTPKRERQGVTLRTNKVAHYYSNFINIEVKTAVRSIRGAVVPSVRRRSCSGDHSGGKKCQLEFSNRHQYSLYKKMSTICSVGSVGSSAVGPVSLKYICIMDRLNY